QALEESLSPVIEKLEQDGIFTELSLVLKSPEELEAGFPLLLDMVDDAKILYDPEQLLANRLQVVRQKLERAGAKRIWRANSWHWDVKGGRFQP
ncbi:MAG: nucleotidyltransferase domain-containing protein, partial [Firmicutes bacterium]|nr:nucleotidyltransferase domain-containing protein [Bacillota bacterium]